MPRRFITQKFLSGSDPRQADSAIAVLQEQYLSIIDGLEGYFDGPLTTGFWNASFYDDITGAMANYNGDNQALALSLQVCQQPLISMSAFQQSACMNE